MTAVIISFVGLTIWGGWPEKHGENGGEQLVSLAEYVSDHLMMFLLIAASFVVFYALLAHEKRSIQRILHSQEKTDITNDPETETEATQQEVDS